MTQKLLQDFRLHISLGCACSAGVPQRVHTKTLDTRFITQLLQARINSIAHDTFFLKVSP